MFMSSEIYNKIKDIVGEDHITDSDFEKIFYSRDVAPLPPDLQDNLGTIPDIIVRPRNTEEVAEIVKIAASSKTPIVPRGGASWWLGGCVPYKGGIVLDLTSLNKNIEIDENALTVTVDCGVPWKEVEDILERKSYFLGSRPGSAASATIGGWLSTGGVGLGAYKYGSVGDLVRSLEVVLPNGDIIETGNKDLANFGAGYNLNRLFVGAEGTLGIITKATFMIIPKPEADPYHTSFSFPDVASCANAIKALVASRLLPHHIAFGGKSHFDLLREMGRPVPDGEIALCIILEGEKGIIDFGISKLNEIMVANNGKSACENTPHEECEDCAIEFRGWKMNVYPVPAEIFVSLNQFETAIEKITKVFQEMNLKAGIVGSIVDRRTVMIMPYYIQGKDEITTFMEFHRRLENAAIEVGGRRLGLGLYFAKSLEKIHGPASVALMHSIKRSLDPDNIMNPGKTISENDIFSEMKEF
jgi:glycolate oxidase